MDVSIVEQPSEADFKRLGDGLSAYTSDKGGAAYSPVKVLFRAGDQGEVWGELIASMNWKQFEVTLILVQETARGKGVGSALMAAAEAFARKHDCFGIELSTTTFQGEGFYERLGYEEVFRRPIDPGALAARQYKINYSKPLKP